MQQQPHAPSARPTRSLPLTGATNFRDLGGYIGHRGQQVKWRRIFRSDHLAALTPQDQALLAELQSALTQPIVEQAVAYARSVNEIVAEGQQEISRLFETQFAELQKTFTAALEHAAKSAPAGSEPAFEAVRSAMETASSVYENASQSVQQLAEANAAKAAEVTEAAVKVLAVGKAG